MMPYITLMRLDKPIGIVLLALPCLWGLAFAPVSVPLIYYAYFILGAICMRSAGCVVNDIWDRNIDKHVTRTQNRPLANGDINVMQALICLTVLLLIGLLILLQFNRITILIGFISVPLVMSYPLMKRITYWPQIFLGVTFNIGVLMAWTAVMGSLFLAPVLLYIAAICWTVMYDTVYAFQDIDDDIRIGVKSSAIAVRNHAKRYLYGLLFLQYVLICSAVFAMKNHFTACLVFTPALIFECFNIYRCQLSDSKKALSAFMRSAFSGVLVWLGLLLI